MSAKIEVMEANEENALAAFNGKIKLQNILDYVANEARAYESDASTSLGRKEIAAIAYKVSRSKTLIDSVGKDMVSEWKTKAKEVDAQRKIARDFLDSLRDEIRKPVTDWEEEQKRIAEEERLKEEAEQAARLAELERREAELKAKEDAIRQAKEAERIEKERVEREKQIANDAAKKAKIEAEEKALQEKLDLERREQEAIEAKKLAENNAKEAAELAELRAKQAKEQAEEESRLAVEAEKMRVQKEKDDEIAAIKKREANKKHKAAINNSAMDALVSAGLNKSDAKLAVIEIAKGNIPNVRVEY